MALGLVRTVFYRIDLRKIKIPERLDDIFSVNLAIWDDFLNDNRSSKLYK